jgi:quercetin dioxygenase-like cupin family protein
VEPSRARHHEHAGIEFLYLISGKLALRIGEDDHELAEGDAIYFDSTVSHSYRRIGNRRTSALVLTVAA